jgi:hypothetical protein
MVGVMGNKPLKPAGAPKLGPILIRMSDVEPRPVQWLWQGRIPIGCITLIVGRPGEGKSFVTTDIAARVSTGSPMPDGTPCERGSVLIISGEDDPHQVIRPRLDAHHADTANIHSLSRVNKPGPKGKLAEMMFTLADLMALEESLKQLGDCKLVIVDPIGSFMGGRVDANRDNEVRALLAPVAKLAEKYGVAVLIVAHRRKSFGDVADDLALGSRAFTGIARAVWHLSSDPGDKRRKLLLAGKCNLAAAADGLAFEIAGNPPSIQWERDPVKMSADEALAKESSGGRRGPDPKALAAATDWMKTVLADLAEHPVEKLKELAKAAGHNWRTVERARKALGALWQRESFGGRYVWRLPKPGSPPAELPANMPAKSPEDKITRQPGEQGEVQGNPHDSARQDSLPAKLISLGEQGGYGERIGLPDAPHVTPMTSDERAMYGEPAGDGSGDDSDEDDLDLPDAPTPDDFGPDGEPIWTDEAEK